MIVGETINVARTETRPYSFKATNPTLTITNPDGTAYGSSPTILVTPGSSSTSQTLSANVTPTQGGYYKFVWTYQDSLSETIHCVEYRYGAFTDPYALIRIRLQEDVLSLPDAAIDPELSRVARRAVWEFPQIGYPIGQQALPGFPGIYNNLTGDDAAFFDEFCALAVCCSLVGPLSTNGASADLQSSKEGDSAYRFVDTTRRNDDQGAPGALASGPGGYSGQNERKRWYAEAAQSIGSISNVANSIVSNAQTFQMFVVSGPTRTARTRCTSSDTLLSRVIRLLTDDDIYQNNIG